MTTDADPRVIHESWFNLIKICDIVPHCEIRLKIVGGIPTQVLEVTPSPIRLDQPETIAWVFKINELFQGASLQAKNKKGGKK